MTKSPAVSAAEDLSQPSRIYLDNSEGKKTVWRTPWSLRRLASNYQSNWKRTNAVRKDLTLPWLSRQLLFAGEHPIRFAVSLLLLFVAVQHLSTYSDEQLFVPRWADWHESEQLAHFSTLWTIQTTLAALVYPIVIAFVTVFLQRRPTSEALVNLYVLDSGALVAGLSSLLLVVVMAAQYALISYSGLSSLPRWTAIDAVWFVVNGALTTRFLFRTIEFLRPEVQALIFRRYAANVALPRDVTRLLLYQFAAQSQKQGWIPGPLFDGEPLPAGPKVLFSGITFREGSEEVKIRLGLSSRLIDVRLWPLRLVVTSWLRSATGYALPAPTAGFDRTQYPLLQFPCIPGGEYQGVTSLARVDKGPRLRKWQQLLLQMAFRFQPITSERYGIRVGAILDELASDVRQAAEHSNVEAFEVAYDSLVSLHELLLGASLVTEDDGGIGSVAMLPDATIFSDKTLHVTWADRYRSVFLAATHSMETDTRPLRRLCHLIQHIDGDALQQSPLEVREHFLLLPQLMMYQMGAWWIDRIEAQGVTDHGHHAMVSLKPPLHRVYEEVVSTFVSGWEQAKSVLAKIPSKLETENWKLISELGRLNAAHIQGGARLLLAAVFRGDRVAAEWLADALNKTNDFDYDREPYQLFGKTSFLTIDDLARPWSEVTASLALATDDARKDEIPYIQRGVLIAAFENFSEDIRLLVVELLLTWTVQEPTANLRDSLAMEIAAGLLTGKQWRAGGSVSRLLSSLSAAQYLSAKVRQTSSSGNWRSGYIGRLDQFVERVADMQRPDMIGGRVYGRMGADDVASLQDAQLLIFAALSGADWGVPEELRRQIEEWLSSQFSSIDLLSQQLRRWIDRLQETAQVDEPTLANLIVRLAGQHDHSAGRERTLRGLGILSTLLSQQRDALLLAEPIDPQRLRQIAAFASKRAFSDTAADFPIPLFAEHRAVDHALTTYTLVMRNVRKGELTRTEIDQRVSNESSFWEEAMAERVGALVMADVVQSLNVRDILAITPEQYWTAVKNAAAAIVARNELPVLVLDNATRPAWVWDWQHVDYGSSDHPKPDDLHVHRIAERSESYICNFNDIEVYGGGVPVGQSLLMSGASLVRVDFGRCESGDLISAKTDVSQTSPLLVDLKLTFSRQVHVGAQEAIRIHYEKADQSAMAGFAEKAPSQG